MPKPLLLVLAIVTCVGAGAALNKCLTCPTPQNINASVTVQGVPFNPPTPPIDTEANTADETEAVVEKVDPKPPAPVVEEPAEKVVLPKLPVKTAKKIDGKWREMSFDTLASYEYTFPEIGEENPTDQIPERIKKLKGENVAIQGFMIPIKNQGEEVIEFVLVRNPFACCFGVIPKMNEWIHVKMIKDKTAPYALDIPITCYGELEVGEVWENGVVMSLYRLKCSWVEEPPTFR